MGIRPVARHVHAWKHVRTLGRRTQTDRSLPRIPWPSGLVLRFDVLPELPLNRFASDGILASNSFARLLCLKRGKMSCSIDLWTTRQTGSNMFAAGITSAGMPFLYGLEDATVTWNSGFPSRTDPPILGPPSASPPPSIVPSHHQTGDSIEMTAPSRRTRHSLRSAPTRQTPARLFVLRCSSSIVQSPR